MKKYYEKKLVNSCNKTIYEIATDLCKDEKESFYLYDNNEGVSIGVGIYMEIIVTSEELVVHKENNEQRIRISDFCQDMDHLLESVDVDSWRAYGIANFGLARHLYGLEIGAEAKEMLHLIIPNKEYRLQEETLLLRTLNEEELEIMESNIVHAFKSKENEQLGTLYDREEILAFDQEYYKQIVELGVKDIKERKYNKVILSRRIPVEHRLNMLQTYRYGRSKNTPERSYYYRLPNLEVVGFSPETIIEVDATGTVHTFPLAGTRALTNDAITNNNLKTELLNDPKEIAEHAISVKLADEEMEQVCVPSSVVVSEFMSILKRGTVQHLGSKVRGQLKEEYNPWHAFCKLFPAVTASGIPKKEAIEAIGRIEREPRNLYSGSVLTYDQNKTLDAALVLRSVFQNSEETWVRVGAGIVEMSKPEREFTETQEKVSCVAEQLVME